MSSGDVCEGEVVRICALDELTMLFNALGLSLGPDLSLEMIAGAECRIAEVPPLEVMQSETWDGQILLDFGAPVGMLFLPAAVLTMAEEPSANSPTTQHYIVEEPSVDSVCAREEARQSSLLARLATFESLDLTTPKGMAFDFAASRLQHQYRRYAQCRDAVKLKRAASQERLVQTLAAETIKDGLRRSRSFREGLSLLSALCSSQLL
jgi:hypothetical protein